MKTRVFLILTLLGIFSLPACPQKEKAGDETDLPQMPMQAPYEHTLEYAWSQKKVLDSKVLSDAEVLSPWQHHGEYGSMVLTNEKAHTGQASLLITSPTKGPSQPPGGRPWGVCGAFFPVQEEDWTDWNRITFWIYPDLPGFKTVSIHTIFYNDGEDKVPGIKNGNNYQVLENGKWNKVYWEIAHLGREKVTGFVIQYRLQGNEPGATGKAKYFIDDVCLEKVEPDHFEGWDVQRGEIAYNHAGYASGFPKTAFLSETSASDFSLIDAASGVEVWKGAVQTEETPTGTFRLLDFTAFDIPGSYCLKVGELQTPPFLLSSFADVYRSSILKTLNHFYTQRCGYRVEGIHDACHLDWLCRHGDRSIAIHGGWHDAGDVSQGLGNTAEATYAMMLLAGKLENTDPILARRLREEARWGTEWVMKTRFGDGFRNVWATKDMWTDGIIGNEDDYQSEASNTPQANYTGAITEAMAGLAFRNHDPHFATYALQCAIEDFDFASSAMHPEPSVELAGKALNATLLLYEATGTEKYRKEAVKLADYIVRCQQQTDLEADIPLKGFFYQDATHETILHYPHHGQEYWVVTGLVKMADSFPDRAEEWSRALRLYAEYYKTISVHTAPYYMIPAGIYDLTKARNEEEREQIRQGIRLNDRYFIKRFPVWGEFRGNSGIMLPQAKGLADVATYLGDQALADLVYHQLEWHLGKNPFAQSLMYGEGYRYAGQYSVMSGNLVGGLPVGVQTHFNRDLPYWPAENCHNWKEIWVHPSSVWLLILANFQDR